MSPNDEFVAFVFSKQNPNGPALISGPFGYDPQSQDSVFSSSQAMFRPVGSGRPQLRRSFQIAGSLA
jgi:hypothetical protein